MPLNNATILNQVRANLVGSNDYQQRVPEATQANLTEVVENIFSHKANWNTFIPGMLNLIGNVISQDREWFNPLRIFKRNDLLVQGDTLVEYGIHYVEAQGYDVRDNDLFKLAPPKVQEAFYSIDREDKYTITISVNELRKAFLTPNGVQEFLERRLAIVGRSDQYDEYRIMLNVIAEVYNDGGLYNINVEFADPTNPTDVEVKNLVRKIRATAARWEAAPSTIFNRAGIPTTTPMDRLVLIISPEVRAAMDVDVLAVSFNMDRTNFLGRVIVVDELPYGIHALLCDEGWFIAGDYVYEVDSFYNPSNLTINSYLHHWGIYNSSPFVNAAVFTNASTVVTPSIVVTLASIAVTAEKDGVPVTEFNYGDKLQLVTTATGTVNPDNPNVKVPAAATYEVNIDGDIPLNNRTYVDDNGVLYVQKGLEAGTKITVKATSTYVNPSGDGASPSPVPTATVVLTVAE